MWYSALLHVCEKTSDTRGDHLEPTERVSFITWKCLLHALIANSTHTFPCANPFIHHSVTDVQHTDIISLIKESNHTERCLSTRGAFG